MPRGGARVGAGRKKKVASVTRLPTSKRQAPVKPATTDSGTAALTKAPAPPPHLNEVAKIEWVRLAPLLVDASVLTHRDIGTLEGYCMAFANCRLAQQEIDNGGLTVFSAQGEKKNPACTVLNEAMGRMLAFGAELGLSPVSRKRLTGGESGKPKNPFTEF